MLFTSPERKRVIVRLRMPRHIRDMWDKEDREIPFDMLDDIPYMKDGVWEVREACGLAEPAVWDEYVLSHRLVEEIQVLRSANRDEADFCGYFGALPYDYAKLPECQRDAAMSARLKKLEAAIGAEMPPGPVPEGLWNSTVGRSVAAAGVICAVLGSIVFLLV